MSNNLDRTGAPPATPVQLMTRESRIEVGCILFVGVILSSVVSYKC